MAWAQANAGKLSYGSYGIGSHGHLACAVLSDMAGAGMAHAAYRGEALMVQDMLDRKSTRLNSSHGYISYAVFCLKKKKTSPRTRYPSDDCRDVLSVEIL